MSDNDPSAAAEAAIQAALEDTNQYVSHYYLYALVGFVVLLVAYRVTLLAVEHMRTLACLQNSTQRYFAVPSQTWSKIKSNVIYAPLFRLRHNREWRLSTALNMGTLPTRFQAVFITSILTTNVGLCVYQVPWSNPEADVLPILCNRAGTMAVANLIPIVVLATVKNPLIQVLNISFDSFNMMHRWFGRISVLQAITHALCWTIGQVQAGGWESVQAQVPTNMIWTGIAGIVAMVAIAIQSMSVIRHAFYEFFLHFHITLVVLLIVVLWMHLAGTLQQMLLLAAIILWGLTRFLRLATLLQRSVGRGGCKASIEALPGDALRVTLTSPRPWTFRPGQYMYVTIPSVGMWTAHPFTVAWSEIKSAAGTSISNSSLDAEKKGLEMLPDSERNGRRTFSAIIRRRTGFTNGLYQYAEKTGAVEGAQITVPALIEGPYGASRPLSSYGTVMLFAGGVGITHQMPYVKELVQGYTAQTVAARKVVLVWIIQSPDHLEWVRPWMTEILSMEKRREVLKIMLFITRPRNVTELTSPSATVQMFPGRPSVDALIGKECEAQIGAMGVSVCGTGELQDDVRRAVREKGRWSNIDFIEESFSW